MLEFEVGELIHDAAKIQKVYLCTKIIAMNGNLFTENLKRSTGMRAFLFLIILLFGTLIGRELTLFFASSGNTGIKIGQGLASIFMFVVPPIVYYLLTRKEHQMQALGFRRLLPPWWLILVGVALMYVAIPFTTKLTTRNESMHLGGAFAGLEAWMKEMEETAKAELNQKAYELFARLDAEMEAKKAECEAEGHKCMHEIAEMTEEQKAECEAKCAEMKAKCEEMKAAWENFENLSLDEQKDLVLGRIAAMGMGEKKCDHHEGEEHQCCKHEGEEHQCQQATEVAE